MLRAKQGTGDANEDKEGGKKNEDDDGEKEKRRSSTQTTRLEEDTLQGLYKGAKPDVVLTLSNMAGDWFM